MPWPDYTQHEVYSPSNVQWNECIVTPKKDTIIGAGGESTIFGVERVVTPDGQIIPGDFVVKAYSLTTRPDGNGGFFIEDSMATDTELAKKRVAEQMRGYYFVSQAELVNSPVKLPEVCEVTLMQKDKGDEEPCILMSDLTEGGEKRMIEVKQLLNNSTTDIDISPIKLEEIKIKALKAIEYHVSLLRDNGICIDKPLTATNYGFPHMFTPYSVVLDEDGSFEVFMHDFTPVKKIGDPNVENPNRIFEGLETALNQTVEFTII